MAEYNQHRHKSRVYQQASGASTHLSFGWPLANCDGSLGNRSAVVHNQNQAHLSWSGVPCEFKIHPNMRVLGVGNLELSTIFMSLAKTIMLPRQQLILIRLRHGGSRESYLPHGFGTT